MSSESEDHKARLDDFVRLAEAVYAGWLRADTQKILDEAALPHAQRDRRRRALFLRLEKMRGHPDFKEGSENRAKLESIAADAKEEVAEAAEEAFGTRDVEGRFPDSLFFSFAKSIWLHVPESSLHAFRPSHFHFDLKTGEWTFTEQGTKRVLATEDIHMWYKDPDNDSVDHHRPVLHMPHGYTYADEVLGLFKNRAEETKNITDRLPLPKKFPRHLVLIIIDFLIPPPFFGKRHKISERESEEDAKRLRQ